MSQEHHEQSTKQMIEENQENGSKNNVQSIIEGEQQQQQQLNHQEGSRNYEEGVEIVEKLKHNAEQVTEKYLESRLQEAVNCYKHNNFDQAENIFSDLMICAVKFYKSETNNKMSKFFFFYGDMLLSKLENNPDVFGEKAQKKVENNSVEGSEQNSNQMVSEETNQQKGRSENENEEDDEGQSLQGEEQEEIVQLDTVIFKDENVEIRDETDEARETSENQNREVNNTPIGQVSLEKSDPIDDLQLAWEHLELARKIYNQELVEIQQSSEDDKKEKQVLVIRQLIEITLRIGDLESWRDNLTEAVKEYTKALELSKQIEDRESSRTLSSVYFQLGNALLYENKDFCEEEALRNFVDSAQILENCLSSKIAIPPQEIPSFKILKKEDIQTDHLKHSFLDDNESKEIKDTLKILYEKIEDTIIQKDDRDKYKAYQEQMKKQVQNQNQFAQPTQTNVPIKNLGTFGSLKRKEPTDSNNTTIVGSIDNANLTQEKSSENANENSGVLQMSNDGTVDKMIKKD